MRTDIRFVTFLLALGLLAACPLTSPTPATPTPPAGTCFTPISGEGRTVEAKPWDGQAPDLSGRRIGWVMTQLQGQSLASAVDLDKGAVVFSTLISDEKVGELDGNIKVREVILIKIGMAVISGTRPGGTPPVPQGDDLMRLIEQQLNSALATDFVLRTPPPNARKPGVDVQPPM